MSIEKIKSDKKFYKFHAEEGIEFLVGEDFTSEGDFYGFVPMSLDVVITNIEYNFPSRISGDVSSLPIIPGMYIPISGGFRFLSTSSGKCIVYKSSAVPIGGFPKEVDVVFITDSLNIGQLIDNNATNYQVLTPGGDYSVDSFGNLAFITQPEYDVSREYNFVVRANSGIRYNITAFYTILTTTTVLDGTEIMYDDTYVIQG